MIFLKRQFGFIAAILAVVISIQLSAAEALNSVEDRLRAKLKATFPSVSIESIEASSVDNLYEVIASGQVLYITADAEHLISGRLFGLQGGLTDLTEAALTRLDLKRAPERKSRLAEIPKEDFITYKAADEQYRISVFTDVDCGFCRKLHRNMKSYNDLGITIQYLGFPRAGIGSSSHAKLRTVWCAEDPIKAMDEAKLNRQFGNSSCDDPLQEHMQMVRAFGISGTPAIILESGRLIPGFVEPDQLIQELNRDREYLKSIGAQSKGN